MARDPGLDRTQRWLQAVILHRGGDAEAVSAPAAQAEIPAEHLTRTVLPSRTLSSLERVGIYRGMYVARLQEALEVDYPGLLHFLGAEGFSELVRGYVEAFPSRSYTLNRLGDHLPEYILEAPDLGRRSFLHDLARLELAMSQVFDAPRSEVLSPDQIAALPPDFWEGARLKPVEAFRLLAFRYPVNAWLQSVWDETPHPPARRRNTWVAVYRSNYRLWRMDLTLQAYRLLKSLVEGSPLGEAVASVCSAGRRRVVGEEQLFRWFRDWVSEGLFQPVELSRP